MSGINVQLIDGQVLLHITMADDKKLTVALTTETAIGIGSALIRAGRDAAISSN